MVAWQQNPRRARQRWGIPRLKVSTSRHQALFRPLLCSLWEGLLLLGFLPMISRSQVHEKIKLARTALDYLDFKVPCAPCSSHHLLKMARSEAPPRDIAPRPASPMTDCSMAGRGPRGVTWFALWSKQQQTCQLQLLPLPCCCAHLRPGCATREVTGNVVDERDKLHGQGKGSRPHNGEPAGARLRSRRRRLQVPG